MTLLVRNNFLKGMIAIASLSLCLVIVCGYIAFPAFPHVTSSASVRSGGMVQQIIEKTSNIEAYSPFWTMLCAVAYSLVSVTLIYRYFEKTQTPEILFFALYCFSLSLECARIMIPLKEIRPFPAMFLITATQILLFGRFFGLSSLFAASVFAAGFDIQKQRNVFFMLILASLIIALNVPVDSLAWDTSLKALNGYNPMLNIVETCILTVTIITFLISAYMKTSITYIFLGSGTLMAFAGRNILVKSDTLITPLPGLLLLSAGTWLICSRLHKEYLWL